MDWRYNTYIKPEHLFTEYDCLWHSILQELCQGISTPVGAKFSRQGSSRTFPRGPYLHVPEPFLAVHWGGCPLCPISSRRILHKWPILPRDSEHLRHAKKTLCHTLRGFLLLWSFILKRQITWDGEGKPISLITHSPNYTSLWLLPRF